GAAGHDYQWQISSDNNNWSNTSAADTNTTYTTTALNGTTKKYYRLMSQSNACWNVASTTATIDVSNPVLTITVTGRTDQSLTLNWTPVGSGNYNISYSGTSSGSASAVTPPYPLGGLTANGTYSITITQTGAGLSGCPASGVLTGQTTLC